MACDTQVVRITQNGIPDPSSDITLSMEKKHRIVWISESDQAWEIRFEGGRSPFNKGNKLHVAAFGWAESGEIVDGAIPKGKKEERYTYHTYAASTGQLAADPDVIIQN